MKKRKIVKVFVMLFFITCLFSYAYQIGKEYVEHFWTGNGFIEVMRDKSDPMSMIPLGYIVGIDNALNEILWEHSYKVTPGQLVDVVKNYLEKNPGVRHKDIFTLVIEAFKEEFPEPKVPLMVPNPELMKNSGK